jgi:hypothetical protein
MSAWLTGFLLALAPLLMLVALLVLGRYPGEATIARTRKAIAMLLRPVRSGISPDLEPDGYLIPARGGTLIGSSLAGRAPPLALRFPTVISE